MQKKKKIKRLKKTKITTSHHTPILNGSSSSSVNSRQLALKFINLLPLLIQDTFFFRKSRSCILCQFRKSEFTLNFKFPIKQGRFKSTRENHIDLNQS